jgi:GNAT superfamily N-acetyltransferase
MRAKPPTRARRPSLKFDVAGEDDATAVVSVLTRAAEHLTRAFGKGRWSWKVTERGMLQSIRSSRVLVARQRGRIVATLTLTTRRPWAIPTGPFTPVERPLYMVGVAVAPGIQRLGIGRSLLAHAEGVARAWPAHAIRLDTFDAPAGAAPFYERCGYREVARGSYRGVPHVYFEKLLAG